MAAAKSSKGFHCVCGEYTRYPPYAYAHWNEQLQFRCSVCDSVYTVLRGTAILKKKGNKNAADSR